MEEIQLSETEQRYFGDLFVCCDSDNTGKIPIYKASELFRSANLPLDVLKQVINTQHERMSWSFTRNKFWPSVHHYIFDFIAIYFSRHNSIPYNSVSLRVSERPCNPQASVCFEHWWLRYHNMKTSTRQEIFTCSGVRHAILSIAVGDQCVFSRPVWRILFCIADFRIKHPVNSSIRHF